MRKDLIDRLPEIIAWENTAVCPVCGNPVMSGSQPNGAHVIPNDIPGNRIFGKKIIDSFWNVKLVCSMKCNNAIQAKNANLRGKAILYIRKQIRLRGYKPRPYVGRKI